MISVSNDCMTVNNEFERIWKKFVVIYFKVYFLYLHGGAGVDHTKPTGKSVCRPGFKVRPFQIQVRSVTA